MLNLSQTKNIIFDLGGVLLNLNYQRTEDAFVALGLKNFHDLYSQAQQNDLFNLLEIGRISPLEFRESLRSIAGIPFKDQEIDMAWNSMLLDMPVEKIELLEQLKGQFRLFLLSNTNAIHIQSFEQSMSDSNLLERFKSCFEGLYYSSDINLRKPDYEVFRFVLDQHDLIPDETIFIDDSIQHVLGAKKTGISAYHLTDKEELKNIFNGYVML